MATEKEQKFIEKTFDEIALKMAETLKISEGMTEDQKATIFQGWVKSWASNLPQNGNSNRAYNGCNQFFLSMMMNFKGWKHPYFLTFNGVEKLGGTVNKGEKSLPIFWWQIIPIKDKVTGEIKGAFPKIKIFRVFHISQTTVDPSACTIANCEGKKVEEIEGMVAQLGVKILCGEPSYSPAEDVVKMPSIESFKSENHYYSVLMHELSHYTMKKERCNREGDKKLSYAQEELVAELSSMFLCAEFGIQGEFQHKEYISSWIKGIKDQPRAFFDACRLANKAANFILKNGLDSKEDKEETVEEEAA
jgi:antirestriction protein ArdC